MSIVFVGGGNMASALIGGLVAHGQPVDQIGVVEIDTAASAKLQAAWGVKVHAQAAPALADAGTLVLAVKPQQLAAVARALPALDPSLRVISIAAGITTAALSRWLKGHTNIVRAMPNTPALIQQGAAGLYAMPAVSPDDRVHAQSLMRAVGTVVWVEREEQLDAVTAVSGSGPAYVFYFIEVMQRAAQELGLDADTARTLALYTVKGAALLAAGSEDSPLELRQKVTSKGGTTEAALAVLEQGGFAKILKDAIVAAAQRSHDLGQSLDQD
jgi:pyrroline-5-carboxylate reductase